MASSLPHDGDGWTVALPLDELWEGEMLGLRVGDADVLLVNLGEGGIQAYENRCPHARARLSEGLLSAGTVRCAVHHWEFDLRTGNGINPRTCRLRRYAVRIEDGLVKIWVP
ncbi:MAG TPA: Rieske 2Fe-2S domain-containing protein [Polyangiaceae bacterium]|nr:Rieske 2Fe-2S domain-containing protein [Polyangiaceae bacterium]